MHLFGDAFGNFARLQAHGDQERAVLIEREEARAVERVTQLALELAPLGDRARGETRDEGVGVLDGTLNGARPVLAGQQLVLISVT